ncbi:MAG: 3-deoxy-manno-octulosonate cytidylyltransferase [Deltaproteobacteria bacterium]|nr:3-deoxy-manno-octulosonate cytidylyltransferase [Deltaproteobacteria bacterium]MBW2071045.1 3-deoxy-manno-octulosonate cytidylyltransferase [Deltaproteobacteria bacterium]
MPDAVGIIPARFASVRLPGKALAVIAGLPMIQHVHQRASEARLLSRVVVATDDERILEAVVGFGGQALMTAASHASGTDRVAEAARLLNLKDDTLVVNIQGDEPLLAPAAIDELVQGLAEAPEVPMATLAHAATEKEPFHDPSVVKVVFDTRGRALYFSRAPIPANRSAHPRPTYYKHLGIYAYRHSFLQQLTSLPPSPLEAAEKLEQLRVLEHGFHIRVITTSYDSIGVDTPEDLARVRALLAGDSTI